MASENSASGSIDDVMTFDISMPGYEPYKSDAYVCYRKKFDVSGYITEIIPHTHMDRVHHMIVYGCKTSRNYRASRVKPCLKESSICQGAQLIYAWARNSDPFTFSEGIGVPIGDVPEGYSYIAIQAHYFAPFEGNSYDYSGVKLKISPIKPDYFAGIYRLITYKTGVSANTIGSNITMRCKPDFRHSSRGDYAESVDVFAYRIHTHNLGVMVSGYIKTQDDEYKPIGKTHPQFPQNFWSLDQELTMNPGDQIEGVCRYNSSGIMHRTPTGLKSSSEMCNFYVYYKYPADKENPLGNTRGCFKSGSPSIRGYPDEGYKFVPSDTKLQATGDRTTDAFGVIDDPNFAFDAPVGGMRAENIMVNFGEIGGLAMSKDQNMLIAFHRGARKYSNNISERSGKIQENTIALLTANTGSVSEQFGKDMFYLPHGVGIDPNGNVWVTDVASQQVHVVDIETKEIIMSIGDPFPRFGDSMERFYKPTGVAIGSDMSVYVSDGYQNRRVVKINGEDGKFLKEYKFDGNPRSGIIHDIQLDETNQRVFVADREKGDIQIIDLNTDRIEEPIKVGGRIYGIHYCDNGDMLFAVTDSRVKGRDPAEAMKVIAFDMKTKEKLFSFEGTNQGFKNPHAITATKHCDVVYVGEIGSTAGNIMKFDIQHKRKHKEEATYSESEEPEVDREVPM